MVAGLILFDMSVSQDNHCVARGYHPSGGPFRQISPGSPSMA
jgi:hypothetical protein